MTSTGRLLDLLAIEPPVLPAPMAGIRGDETTRSEVFDLVRRVAPAGEIVKSIIETCDHLLAGGH